MLLKYWKTLETTLTAESNYLFEKLALPIHPISSLLIDVMLVFYILILLIFLLLFAVLKILTNIF